MADRESPFTDQISEWAAEIRETLAEFPQAYDHPWADRFLVAATEVERLAAENDSLIRESEGECRFDPACGICQACFIRACRQKLQTSDERQFHTGGLIAGTDE